MQMALVVPSSLALRTGNAPPEFLMAPVTQTPASANALKLLPGIPLMEPVDAFLEKLSIGKMEYQSAWVVASVSMIITVTNAHKITTRLNARQPQKTQPRSLVHAPATMVIVVVTKAHVNASLQNVNSGPTLAVVHTFA